MELAEVGIHLMERFYPLHMEESPFRYKHNMPHMNILFFYSN